MKIILSSRYLASQLSNIKFNTGEWVERVSAGSDQCADSIIIKTNKRPIEITCSFIGGVKLYNVNQVNSRWDWLLSTLNRISERPVVLDINTEATSLIIHF